MLVVILCYGLNFHVLAEEKSSNTSEIMQEKLRDIESKTDGRLGVFAINTENGEVISYRAEEIFPTQCTAKVIGVAAVLKKSRVDPDLLSQIITYSQKDLDFARWNPITKKHLDEGMSVGDLCAAAISFSDHAAMNLLLTTIGGIKGMNDFALSIGNQSFRQDNDWPAEAYSGGKGNVKDSSTPKDMVESLYKILMGEVLDESQSELLMKWLIKTQTGAKRIRSAIPKDWVIGNKTGTGGAYGSTNDIAIMWPPEHQPILIGIYYTSDNKTAKKREDVLSDATKVLIEEFKVKDSKLSRY